MCGFLGGGGGLKGWYLFVCLFIYVFACMVVYLLVVAGLAGWLVPESVM